MYSSSQKIIYYLFYSYIIKTYNKETIMRKTVMIVISCIVVSCVILAIICVKSNHKDKKTVKQNNPESSILDNSSQNSNEIEDPKASDNSSLSDSTTPSNSTSKVDDKNPSQTTVTASTNPNKPVQVTTSLVNSIPPGGWVDGSPSDWKTNSEGDMIEQFIGTVPENGIIVIPNRINGKPITKLSYSILDSNGESATYIKISEGIKRAYDGCLFCKNVREIIIPSTLTDCDLDAFSYLENLRKITLSPNNKALVCENNVLYNSSKTLLYVYATKKPETSYTMPNSVTKTCRGFMQFNTSVTSITLSSHLESISESSFNDSVVNTVVIPNGVESIEKYAFQCSPAIRKITIPNSVTWINNEAFDDYANRIYYVVKGSYADNWLKTNGHSSELQYVS